MKFYLALSSLLLSLSVFAQTPSDTSKSKTVSGFVFSIKDSLGLGGVDVIVKGKASGVLTDDIGRFSIQISDKDTFLIISQEGKIPQEVKIPEGNNFQVYLEDEPLEVQLPYGYSNQNTFTGSIQVVGKKQFSNTPLQSFDQVLQGKVAGVHISQNSGNLTSSTLFRIRGNNSILGGSEPLILIDGMPIVSGTWGDGGGTIGGTSGAQSNPLAEIPIFDIEKVEISKDAWAAAPYGSRGANGIVNLITRKGRPGKTLFNLGVQYGISTPTNRVKMVKTGQYLDAFNQARINTQRLTGITPQGSLLPLASGSDSLLGLGLVNNETNWVDQSLRNGYFQNFDLSATGGNKTVTFFFGGNYNRQKGILNNNDYQRLSARFNSDVRVSDKLKFGSRVAFSLSETHFGFSGTDTTGGFAAAQTRALPYFPVSNNNAAVVSNPFPFNNFFNPYGGSNVALSLDRTYADNQRMIFRTLGTVTGNYEFTKKLWLQADIGFDYFSNFDRIFRSRFIRFGEFVEPSGDTVQGPSSIASDNRVTHFSVYGNVALNYLLDLKTAGKIKFAAGAFIQRVVTKYNGVSSELFPSDYSKLVSFGARQSGTPVGAETGFAFANFYGTAQYQLDEKYMAGVTLASTGSTRFGSETKPTELMPSFAAGWVLSKESFLKSIQTINFLKLRASFGIVGNSLMDNEQSLGFWRGNRPYLDPVSYPGAAPYRIPNNSLAAEKFTIADVGLDFEILENRITGTLGWFSKTNTSVVQSFPLPPSQGLDLPFMVRNSGKIQSSGLELQVTSINIKKDDFSWATDLAITQLKTEVLDLKGLNLTQTAGFKDLLITQGSGFGTYYLPKWAGIAQSNDANGRWVKGDELIYDRNGNPFRPTSVAQIDSNRVLIKDKSINPKLFGGLNNTFTYKNFELSAFLVFSLGNHVLDEGERLSSYLTKNNTLRASAYNSGANQYLSGLNAFEGYTDPLSQVNTTRYLHDASYLRLRNLTIGYNFGKDQLKKLKLDQMKIYFSVQNAFTLTKFKGWDPESSINADGGTLSRNLGAGFTRFDLPQIRTFSAGFNLSF